MGFFQDIISKLLPQKGTGDFIVHQEMINRNSTYIDQYNEWINEKSQHVINEVEEGYQSKLLEREDYVYNIHILKSKYASGIAISYDNDHLTAKEFSYLFDYLADKVKEIPYKLVMSDVSVTQKENFMETKEKHYLKPIKSQNDTLVNQRFGNILIEHILVDDKPSFIKLTASIYSDSKYQKPESFESLLKILFQ